MCLQPHADQALLAFAAGFWCLEVGLLHLLSQALNRSTGVLPALLCCRLRLAAGWPCQGLGTAGSRRAAWPTLRPGRAGLQQTGAAPRLPRHRPAGEEATAALPSRPLAEASARSHAHAVAQARTRAGRQVRTSANMLERTHRDLRLSRHTHAGVEANRPVPARACLPSRGRHVGIGTAAGLHGTSACVPAPAPPGSAAALSCCVGLFLGAPRRIARVFQMLES